MGKKNKLKKDKNKAPRIDDIRKAICDMLYEHEHGCLEFLGIDIDKMKPSEFEIYVNDYTNQIELLEAMWSV